MHYQDLMREKDVLSSFIKTTVENWSLTTDMILEASGAFTKKTQK
jgi:hypothetical protein